MRQRQYPFAISAAMCSAYTCMVIFYELPIARGEMQVSARRCSAERWSDDAAETHRCAQLHHPATALFVGRQVSNISRRDRQCCQGQNASENACRVVQPQADRKEPAR
jgi:hypothetical protein